MSVPISKRFFGDTVTLDARSNVDALLALRAGPNAGDKVIVAHPSNTAKDVIRLFKQKDLHHLPVVDEKNKVVGIVSATDLLNMFVESPVLDPESVRVSEIMTEQPEVVLRETPLQIVVAILSNSPYRCVPVVTEEGYIYSIVTTRDIVRYLNAGFHDS